MKTKKRDFVDRLYFLSSIINFGFGILNLFQPNILIISWGIKKKLYSDELYDIMNLFGVLLLFYSLISAAIPLYLINVQIKRIFTWIFVFIHSLLFLVRLKMFLSQKYHPVTTGFTFPFVADGLFTLGFLFFALFPSTIHNTKPM